MFFSNKFEKFSFKKLFKILEPTMWVGYAGPFSTTLVALLELWQKVTRQKGYSDLKLFYNFLKAN